MTVFLGFTTGLFLGGLIVMVVAALAISAINDDINNKVLKELEHVKNVMDKFESQQIKKDFGIE